MTGDPLRRLQAGDRLASIPAGAWNAFCDAAEYVRAQRATGGVPSNRVPLAAGQVLVRNGSGEDRDQCDVLQISAALITPEENQPEFAARVALVGVKPAGDRGGKFLVLAEPVQNGQLGRAWIDGVCPVRVSGAGAFADVKADECGYLAAKDWGTARILWSEGGDGERWAYVRLCDPSIFGLARTVAGPEDTPYPDEDSNPTVYYAEILSGAAFEKTPGARELNYTETGRHEHIFNLVSDHYIEEGSVIGWFGDGGHLFTIDKLQQHDIVLASISGATTRGLQRRSKSNAVAIGDPVWDALFASGFRRLRSDAAGNVYTQLNVSTTGRIGYTVHTPKLQFIRHVEQEFVEYPHLDPLIGTTERARPLGEIEVLPDGTVWTAAAGREQGPAVNDIGLPEYYRVHALQAFDIFGEPSSGFFLQGDSGGGITGCEVLLNGLAVRADGQIVCCVSVRTIGPSPIVRYALQCYDSAGVRAWEYDITTAAAGVLYRKPGEIACASHGASFVAFENRVIAVDADGNPLWTYDGAGTTDRVFTVCTDSADDVYFYGYSATLHTVRKLSGTDGAVLWTYQTPNEGQTTPYPGSGTNGETVSFAARIVQENAIVWHQGSVYFVVQRIDDAEAAAASAFRLAADTGALVWSKNTGRDELQACPRAGRWPLFG